jgi:hypothetical protein
MKTTLLALILTTLINCTPQQAAVERNAIVLACEDVAPLAEKVLAARAAATDGGAK